MLQVVAAIIERDGKILVGQRTPAQSHPLQWEFPGGKVESGETPAQALARELEEELAIRGATSREITRYQFTYPGKKPIELIFLRVTAFEGEPRNLIYHEIRWQPKLSLSELDFLEGDREFLNGIYTGRMATAIKRVEPAENELVASLEAKTKQPSPFFRVMANRPEVLKTFTPLYGAIMGPGPTDRRVKEAVYLAVAFANKCAFCTAAHTAGAKRAGLSDAEIEAIRSETDAGLSDAERAAVAYARELTRKAAASRDSLEAHFSGEQIVEITLVAAMANFTNCFNNGLDVQP